MKSLKLTKLSETELKNSELANSKGGYGTDKITRPLTGYAPGGPGDDDPFGPKDPLDIFKKEY